MKIAIITLGCRTNQAESATLAEKLIQEGHELVSVANDPDICIINSCSVTAKADSQSRQLIAKNYAQGKRVIITGCYAQLNHEYLTSTFPNLHLVFNDKKDIIPTLIPQELSSQKKQNQYKFPLNQRRNRPIIKIQDGCNNKCTYCVIPFARGASRSVPMREVIAEACRRENEGYREIVLSGIHLGKYGHDLPNPLTLPQLLEKLLQQTKLLRIRLSSLEVQEIDDHLLEIMQDSRICKHLHVPLQSASNSVLKRMNRQYDQVVYEKCISNIQKRLKDVAIGTDIIVGFPQETDEEYLETYFFLDKQPVMYFHVFPYSKRSGTMAAQMSGHVPETVKKKRAAELKELSKKKRRHFIKTKLGQSVEVLIEKNDGKRYIGVSDLFFKVLIDSDQKLSIGNIIPVRLCGLADEAAIGIPHK
jgi:threonylcarbamoyladenosine tRNA methylthiotransferase MtaB